MNISLFIAKRYFVTLKKRSFIHRISLLSSAGMALGTASLIIVLSVFNGLGDLTRSIFGTFDPDIQIAPAKGKSFVADSELIDRIRKIPGVKSVSETAEDNALLIYDEKQAVVRVRGVVPDSPGAKRLKSRTTMGCFLLQENETDFALIGYGVKEALSISLKDRSVPLELWYPKAEKIKSLNPETAFNKLALLSSGVFEVEKQFDDKYVITPLNFAKDLFGLENKCSYLDVSLDDNAAPEKIKNNISQLISNNLVIKTSDEQHASLLRAVRVEKFFSYFAFAFILLVISVNIFFSLTMLAVEKRHDVAVLYSLGASDRHIKSIFFLDGLMIGLSGVLLGVAAGIGLCWLQQEFGLVKLGIDRAVINSYPVRLTFSDILLTLLLVVPIVALASYLPVNRARRVGIKEYL